MASRVIAPVLVLAAGLALAAAPSGAPFVLVQPDLFGAPGGQPNAWADYDGDGDLDEFVGFRGRVNRLYRNDAGTFTDVAAAAGVADAAETRAAAWGDFDADGDADLYVGFAEAGQGPNRIYRNDRGRFVDVAATLGIDLRGVSRQPAWIDYDGDGDLDLFAAFRDQPNRLLRNDGGRFTDVTKETGIGDPRKTVGAVWWDFDRDGDLDLFVANQDGDVNGFFRNDHGRFTDAAKALGVDAAGRAPDEGSVGPSLVDYDNDGWIDLFVANYGGSILYRNDRGSRFVDVSARVGLVTDGHAVASAWGDYDNDGRPDLYLGGYLATEAHYRDWLFHNDGVAGSGWRFTERMPDLLAAHDASHGVEWVDYDGNGTLDLSLMNNDPKGGGHWLFRNVGADGRRALNVRVVDAAGRQTLAGAEVRVYRRGSPRRLATRVVDSGSGYCAQNAMPVHVGLGPGIARVDVEVVTITGRGRTSTWARNVDLAAPTSHPLAVRAAR